MTVPPRDPDAADNALPYGPPAPTGPAAEAASDAENDPAGPPAKEVVPDKASGRVGRRINAVKKLSLLTLSPAELRAQAETMITDLAAAANAVPSTVLPGEEPPGLRSEPCVLSNLGPGVIISSSGYRFFTPGESVAALDAVEAYWREAGYEPQRSGGDRTVDRIDPQVRVFGGSIERVVVYAPNDITYDTLIIEYVSVCVAE